MSRMRQQQTKPRLIIMRHSERLDSVLRNLHRPFEILMKHLPGRENLLDTPLTPNGKAHAYHTGVFFRSRGLTPNLIYTSPAMRCVQTADSVLTGLGLRGKRALRIDLALHEPIRKQRPIQSAKFYSSAGYHVDLNYRPIFPFNDSRIILGEAKLQYYRRLYFILHRIIRQLIHQPSATILIVTHRSCVTLLAAMLNLDRIDDKVSYLSKLEANKRGEVNFLSMVIAEYDASMGQWIFLSEFPQT